ncbi:hypothetical protein [Bosea sp. PAMC 26642]|uniref:hypothetical protein n=1 Tax=Bosea sp. (strain PAMC 26642) TaxID=1792307 RepID=UPI0007701F52|nr:hypothetical protein [Bosea sp. PAMC 26642]AMJ60936.1 hypothetical protein AXW83_12095 [Bosea sp. PAMC 26642]
MFGLFEAFSTRVEEQTREFEAAVGRVASRRLATLTTATTAAPVVPMEPSGIKPARAEVVPPPLKRERRSSVVSLKAGKAARPKRVKPALNFA